MPQVVVFDTNVLISAALSPTRKPFRCVELAAQRYVLSVTADEILQEFHTKLLAKCRYDPQTAQAKVDHIRSFSELVTLENTLKAVPRDPTDNKVIECAVLGGAACIVTGDRKHLLPMKHFRGISIVSPAEFLDVVIPADPP